MTTIKNKRGKNKSFLKTFVIYLLLILASLLNSCKKVSNSGQIIGKWKLTEQYSGYVNGGNFQWFQVPTEYSHVLTFSTNNGYSKSNSTTNNVTCSGIYTLQNDTTLLISSNCNTQIETLTISELSSTTLILDQTSIEGRIKNKYIEIK